MNETDIKKPRLTIGMAVHNGEKYIEKALDSILSQEYKDFELVISDNASTDKTKKICLEYASKDGRIRYYQTKKNIGAATNHNNVFKISRGEYFKWASHDDLIAPDFLSKCVHVLDKDPSIVLCHTKTLCIGEDGKKKGCYDYKIDIDSREPHEIFGDIISMRNFAWLLLFGVMRSNSLRKSSLFGMYVGSDRSLIAELSLMGRMHIIPEKLFFRRSHPEAYTEKNHNSVKDKFKWWTSYPKINFPYINIFLRYFGIVRNKGERLTGRERFLCYIQVIKWFFREGWFLIVNNLGMLFLQNTRIGYKLKPLARRILRLGGFYTNEH